MNEKFQIFLSYSHRDSEKYGIDYIREIKRQIQDSLGGEEMVFLDVDALQLGNQWNSKIQDCLDKSKVFICLLSENYLKSEYCTRERLWWAQKEMAKGRLQKSTLPIFYIQLDTADEKILQSWNEMRSIQDDVRPWFPEGATFAAAELVKQRLESAQLLARIQQISNDSEIIAKSISSVPPYNQKFVGRVNELSQIRQICNHSVMAAQSIGVIHGGAGCGKSELAFAYAHGYASEYPGGLFLVPMANVKSWHSAWLKLADEFDSKSCLTIYEVLGLTKDDRKQPPEEFVQSLARQMWLHAAQNGRMLLLLDNLDCMELISESGLKELFPNGMIPENLDIIATTRNTPHLQQRSKAVAVAVGNLGEDAALELLRLHCEESPFNLAPPENDSETAVARELLKFLDHHAWSVEIIAGFLGQEYRHGATPQKILEQLKENFEIKAKYKSFRDIADSNEMLLQPTIGQIKKQELGDEILELASAAAMFSPDAVGKKLLEMLWAKRHGEKTCSKTDSWLWAWETLKDHHLLSTENKGLSRMHRLTQNFFLKYGREKQKDLALDIKNLIKEAEKSIFSEDTAKAVFGLAQFILVQPWKEEFIIPILDWTEDILLEWYQLDKSEDLLKKLEKELHGHDDNSELTYMFATVRGTFYKCTSRFDDALEMYQTALKTAQDTGGKPDIAAAYNNLGSVYSCLGEYSKALDLYKLSLEIKKCSLPENHPSIAVSYNNIALMYNDLGDYNQACEFCNQSLDIFKRVRPENHPDIATAYNSIGFVHDCMGEYSKSLEFYTQSLAVKKRILPANHPDIATSYNNIGSAYYSLGDYSRALEFYTQSLDIIKCALPENHPLSGASCNNIGLVHQRLGEYNKALEFYTQSLDIRKRSLPENHPDIAQSYNNIGLLYQSIGEYSKALEFYTQGLDIRKCVLPEDHPDIAQSCSNIAEVYKSRGDCHKALEFCNQSLDIYKRALPANHPDIATVYNNIGVLYKSLGEYDKALEFYNQCLEIGKLSLPENHPDIATTYDCIGEVYYITEKNEKALDFFKRSMEIIKCALPENHPDLATAYNNIGTVYNSMQAYDKALEFYTRCLEIKKRTLPEDHHEIAALYGLIGLMYDNLEEYEKALDHYNKYLKIKQTSQETPIAETATIMSRISDAYYSLKQYDNALKCDLEILEIRKNHFPDGADIIATTNNNIGVNYYFLGEYKAAIEYHLKSLEIREKIYPANHPETAKSCCHLGKNYSAMRDFKNAEIYFQRGFKILLHEENKDNGTALKFLSSAEEDYRKHKQNSSLLKRIMSFFTR